MQPNNRFRHIDECIGGRDFIKIFSGLVNDAHIRQSQKFTRLHFNILNHTQLI